MWPVAEAWFVDPTTCPHIGGLAPSHIWAIVLRQSCFVAGPLYTMQIWPGAAMCPVIVGCRKDAILHESWLGRGYTCKGIIHFFISFHSDMAIWQLKLKAPNHRQITNNYKPVASSNPRDIINHHINYSLGDILYYLFISLVYLCIANKIRLSMWFQDAFQLKFVFIMTHYKDGSCVNHPSVTIMCGEFIWHLPMFLFWRIWRLIWVAVHGFHIGLEYSILYRTSMLYAVSFTSELHGLRVRVIMYKTVEDFESMFVIWIAQVRVVYNVTPIYGWLETVESATPNREY